MEFCYHAAFGVQYQEWVFLNVSGKSEMYIVNTELMLLQDQLRLSVY